MYHEILRAGEMYVDAAEFEPGRVFTKLAHLFSVAIRVMKSLY